MTTLKELGENLNLTRESVLEAAKEFESDPTELRGKYVCEAVREWKRATNAFLSAMTQVHEQSCEDDGA
jgi:hypothetical protein